MADSRAALPARSGTLTVHSPGDRPPALGEQFDSLEQQHGTNTLGMWVFLASELMFFGMLFTTYTAYRLRFPDGFAEGSRHLDLVLGGVNTAVLIVSTLMMALAEHSAQRGDRRWLPRYLALAILLGTLFLGLKGLEYYEHFQEQLVPGIAFSVGGPAGPELARDQVELFFLFYYAMTGLHAVHLTIGVGVACIMLVLARRGNFLGVEHWPLEMLGLYWNFVDIIWLFLLPLLYLVGLP
jgi:cytochrome c oxidase subunit 3